MLNRSKLLRVVIFASHFVDYSAHLAEALGAKADVLLIADRHSLAMECLPDRLSKLRNIRVGIYSLSGRRFTFDVVPMLLNIIAFRPDIIHFQEYPQMRIYLLGALLRSMARIVITVHDPVPHFGKDAEIYVQRPLRSFIMNRIRNSAHLLLAHGRYCRESLSFQMKKARVEETRHGVILVPPPELMRQPIAGRILCFGRMEAYKGLEILLAATQLLVARGLRFSLHVVGRGSDLERLRTRFECLPNVVMRLGFIRPVGAIAEFQEASVVVLPYLEASQSGVAAAAFANGRPVLATDVGGLTDVVDDGVNGLVIKPSDPKALADALEAMLDSPLLLQKMRDGARETARTLMNWNEIASELIEYYELLLK
jgi:glycosyltransferase involved in cell wall biosynthesis